MPKFDAVQEEYFTYQNLHKQGGKKYGSKKPVRSRETSERIHREVERRANRRAAASEDSADAL